MSNTFNPTPKTKNRVRHILCIVSDEEYKRIKAAALENGVSLREFVYQGVQFAVDHLKKD